MKPVDTGLVSINGFGVAPPTRFERDLAAQAAKRAPPPGTRCPDGRAPFPQYGSYYCPPSAQCKSPKTQYWNPAQRKWICHMPEKSALQKVASGAKTVAKVVTKPIVAVSAAVFNKLVSPLRNRVTSLKKGRALKLAQLRRKSNVPTAAENNEAAGWTKAKLKSGGPQGYLLALFAGADTPFCVNGLGMSTNLGVDPATMSLIAASLPPLTLLLNNVLKKAGAAGEIASQTVQAYAASNVPGYQPGAPVPSAAQYAQQAASAYVPPEASAYIPPAAASYVPEAVPQFEPQAEYSEEMYGAVAGQSNFKTGALLTGLAVIAGTGAFFIYKRKRRRRR